VSSQPPRRRASHAPTSAARQLGFESLGTPLIDTTFVVLDLETTGLKATDDRITEIGAVKVRGGEVLGELRTFVHPGCAIPPSITAVTGITDAMVRDAPTLVSVLPSVLRFLDGAVFVAHNAAFDLGFLRAAAARIDLPPPDPVVVDTARLARRLVRDEVRNCRLSTLAAHFRSPTRPEHRALADARATVSVLHGLIERAGSLGATTLEDLRDLARSSSDQAFRRRGLVADAPAAPGVYRFLDARGEVLYVGKATDLRSRLRTYFGQDPRRRIADMVRETAEVRWTTTATLIAAEIEELRLIHAHRPRYNRRSTRPESAVHVAVTDEVFPRLSIVREPRPSHRATFGPLPSRRAAEQLLEGVHQVTGLRTCTTRLRAAQDHGACVLKDLGRCGAPCDGTIDRDGHAAVVAAATALFDDPTPLLAGLRASMDQLAEDGRFEDASRARRRLHHAARAVRSLRNHATLGGLALVVAARHRGERIEVVIIRRGRLVTTMTAPRGTDETDLLGQVSDRLGVDDRTPPRTTDAEEVGQLAAWLAGADVRPLRVEGDWVEPVAGGGLLATTVAEARTVARAVQRDRQELHGTKVRRRTSA
jgi:DNA polymerase III subunit epsilon